MCMMSTSKTWTWMQNEKLQRAQRKLSMHSTSLTGPLFPVRREHITASIYRMKFEPMHNHNHECFILLHSSLQTAPTWRGFANHPTILTILSILITHWCSRRDQILHTKETHFLKAKSYLFPSLGPSAPAISHHRECCSQKPDISWKGWHMARIYHLLFWTICPSWTHDWAFHSLHFYTHTKKSTKWVIRFYQFPSCLYKHPWRPLSSCLQNKRTLTASQRKHQM